VGCRVWIALLAVCAASGQDNAVRKANDYPAHEAWPRFEIGAEYLVHSIPTEKGVLYGRDYLVVEVAIFPGKQPVTIASNNFTLRLNGKKVLLTEAAGFVAASLKYADWEQRATLTGTAQVGDGTVVIGKPPQTARFPGDPTQDRRMPPPRRPDDPDAAGVTTNPLNLDRLVALASLPELETREKVKGCLYFSFTGKSNSIRTLDLEYEDGSLLRVFAR
jgi:hypothetical protein